LCAEAASVLQNPQIDLSETLQAETVSQQRFAYTKDDTVTDHSIATLQENVEQPKQNSTLLIETADLSSSKTLVKFVLFLTRILRFDFKN